MLLNNSKELTKYLDRLNLMFLFKRSNKNKDKSVMRVKVYFICSNIKKYNEELIYYFLNEHLFLTLEFEEFDSKLKRFKMIINRYDLEKIIEI